MVDDPDLKSVEASPRVGSSPISPTMTEKVKQRLGSVSIRLSVEDIGYSLPSETRANPGSVSHRIT